MTICAGVKKLTLSNIIQGIYYAELGRQHSGSIAANFYKHRQRFTQIPSIAHGNSPLSKRSFSTSQTYADESTGSSDKTTSSERPDNDVLTELISTKAKSTSRHCVTATTAKSLKQPADKTAAGQKSSNEEKKEKKVAIKSTFPPSRSQKKQKLEPWRIQKEALKEKFQEGWHPRKKLSPDTLDTIRHLHATKPNDWTTPVLAEQFKVSPEAIRRILKSKWQPSDEERQKRQERWEKRHDRIWSHMEELGLRPKKGERTAKVSDARRLGLESPPSSPS